MEMYAYIHEVEEWDLLVMFKRSSGKSNFNYFMYTWLYLCQQKV